MRLFTTFLILLSFLGAGKAKACSIAPWAFSGLDNYGVYDRYKLDNIRDGGMDIALVKVRKLKNLPINPDKVLWDDHDIPNTLYEMRLEVIEVVQGTFSSDETIIVPKLSDQDKEAFKLRLNRDKDFNFWDGFQLTRQASTWYGDRTSCGPHGEIVLKNRQHYLIGRTHNRFSFIEPVYGLDDNFVKDIRNLVDWNEDSPLRIDAKSFLANMEGYKIFYVTECPSPIRENAEDVPLRHRYRHLSRENYDELKHIQSVVEETTNTTKLKPQNFILRKECQTGERFLVLEKQYESALPNYSSFMEKPKHRYLKITDGKIYVEDIPTNYEFTGEKIIPVEQVKAWIREGFQADAMTE